MNIGVKWKTRIGRTNLSGPSNIVRADSILFQVVWFLIYIVSVLVTFYLIAESLIKYTKCQVNTNVRRNLVTALDFPKVTFCNRYPLGTDFFLDMYKKANATYHMDQYYVLLMIESFMKNTSGRYLTLAEKRNMSDLEGLVISCKFRNKPCILKKDFIEIFDAFDMNCIRFNSGIDSSGRSIGSKKVYSANDELNIEFYVGLPNQITSFYPNKYLYVWIHDFSMNFIRLPDPMFISAGFDIVLQATPYVYKQFNQWPFGYSECMVGDNNTLLKPLSDPSIFESMCDAKISYTRTSCLNFCFQELLAQKCGCIDYWPNVTIAGYEYCLDAKAKCSSDFFYNVFAIKDFIDKNCLDRCPAECFTRGLSYKLAFQRYPEASYAGKTLKTNPMLIKKYANQSDFESNLAQSVLRMTIRYDSLAYKEMVEKPRMSWKSLLGELGGYLHIFLGMSLISFIEIFELIGFFVSESLRSLK